MNITPEQMYERMLNVYVLNGQDRAYYRGEFRRAMLAREVAVIEEYAYGGDSSEDSYDCPREPGSKHARPEGLSAGARWREGI